VVYVQVFFLVTFLENRKKIVTRKGSITLGHYPAVTIMVPAFNEESTIYITVRSLLLLHYPKDKIKILLIDDGSTDGTWNAMQKFSHYPNIKVFQKENGGKYTALNLGLEHVETDFVGCLDADSFVDPEALSRIMSYFQTDPSIMAVAPSVVVHNPKSILQQAQRVEYYMSVYFKKMHGFMGAIHVTPGPFTIFRKKVFNDLGNYTKAHNTEDMEIAYRMQKNHYKIEHCNDAFVYTNTPPTVVKLFKQRLRWTYGSINNTFDYRKVLFKKQYGNFSWFTLPTVVISIVSAGYLFSRGVYSFGSFLYSKIVELNLVGFHFSLKLSGLDLFFINTQSLIFVVLLYSMIILSMVVGRRMAEGKWGVSLDMIYFFTIFTIIAPLWLMKAIYDTVLSKKPAWK
jgi:cellulose synthase/poly-beta-1,6-N-acetylglucosamine synthase-like glycosyltransferase